MGGGGAEGMRGVQGEGEGEGEREGQKQTHRGGRG